LKLTKCVFRSCNVWKLSKELNDHCNVHQLFIATSLQMLLPVIQTYFFLVPRFSIRRNKNPQKLNVIFLDQIRRNYRLYSIYLKKLINKYVYKCKRKLYVCFVDFKKAFDSVWRSALFLKLWAKGIKGLFYMMCIQTHYLHVNTKICILKPLKLTKEWSKETA
jgi:hypothetical protein